jgi:predicted nucleic acid-binding protein
LSLFVLDASATLSWCIEAESTPWSRDLLIRASGGPFSVPDLWLNEVANGLLVQERRKRLDRAQVAWAIRLLQSLDTVVDAPGGPTILGAVTDLARDEGLTVYDARYLELAQRRGLPLASLDKALCDAARRRGVSLI